jgi:hypothetical protein
VGAAGLFYDARMHQEKIVTLVRQAKNSASGDRKRRSVKISTARGESGLLDLRLDEWSEWCFILRYAQAVSLDISSDRHAYDSNRFFQVE